MSTLKDIAKRANVSYSTVSRILNGKNKEVWGKKAELAKEVRALAKEMGYRPNSAARAIQNKSNKNIAIITPGIATSSRSSEFISEVTKLLQERHYIPFFTQLSNEDTLEDAKVFQESFYEGIISVNLPEKIRIKLKELSPNMISINSDKFESENCIRRDEFDAGFQAAQAIIDAGHKKIHFICLDHWDDCPYSVFDRCEGAKSAATKAGIDINFIEIIALKDKIKDFESVITEAINEHDAVIGWNLGLTQWCSSILLRSKLVAGYNYSLICCESTNDLWHMWPDLSHVDYDLNSIAKDVASKIIPMIEEDTNFESYTVKGELQYGKTILKIHE